MVKLCVYNLSTVLQSYRADGRVFMKGCNGAMLGLENTHIPPQAGSNLGHVILCTLLGRCAASIRAFYEHMNISASPPLQGASTSVTSCVLLWMKNPSKKVPFLFGKIDSYRIDFFS